MTVDGRSEQINQLIESVNSQNYREHYTFVEQLVEIGEAAADLLAARLTDADYDKRHVILWALAKLHDSRAIEPLIQTINIQNASSIGRLLIEIGEPAVEPLIAVLNDEYAYKRAVAAFVLGQLKDKQAVEPLRTLLDDKTIAGGDMPPIGIIALMALNLGAQRKKTENGPRQVGMKQRVRYER